MLCAGPYKRGVEEWPCGKCDPCLMNRQRLWVARLMLEGSLHERKCFATLTYDGDHLPGDGSLVPRHLELFLKRLRRRLEPIFIRYFGVGEYGERGGRPHYHVLLFGVDRIEDIQIAWAMGHVHVGLVTEASIAYTVGYLLKRLTRKGDPLLKGRHPEFSSMSRRPHGLGAGALEFFADTYYTEAGCNVLIERKDVVHEFRTNGEKYPLGRYLRNKLREMLGRPSGEPLALREERLKLLSDELSLVENWKLREARREATRERARARIGIRRSVKGVL